ncbi:hypothetical protein BDV37DRAFT_283980 [Aspergillus pseudonomiae]|uniref:NADH:flavin oxidoreductase/NADH oxidase N-terminal domain-containing protein n=1 Tax=Aspergillus pseudonomiae TaxID=1506151 RepID=A0A5N7DAX3_9EURO|nr:uncharacterized protein BDV37DRAFT_283980 [Aspergillus pseudonomiae]KAE8403183.1 hypothetical protein BDV37DRAFT_283980 [Aspergillus pseudonomiae]
MPEEKGWKVDDTVRFAEKVKFGVAFQVPFAAAVKKAVGDKVLVAAVGMINNGTLADQILNENDLDVILGGRAFQRDTGFAKDLDIEIAMAAQIRWGFTSFRNASEYIQPNSMKASTFE